MAISNMLFAEQNGKAERRSRLSYTLPSMMAIISK